MCNTCVIMVFPERSICLSIRATLKDTVSMNLAQWICCQSLRKNYRITLLPPLNGYLSTTATFLRPQGGCCGEVRLCSVRTPKQLLLLIAKAITLMFHREQNLQTSEYNFFRERKAHVMIPHNTGLTGVETIYCFGFGPEHCPNFSNTVGDVKLVSS